MLLESPIQNALLNYFLLCVLLGNIYGNYVVIPIYSDDPLNSFLLCNLTQCSYNVLFKMIYLTISSYVCSWERYMEITHAIPIYTTDPLNYFFLCNLTQCS